MARSNNENAPPLWIKCKNPRCGATVYKKAVEERLQVCPECDCHFSLTASERLRVTLDPDTFEEFHADLAPTDPLGFADLQTYPDRLERYQRQTGLKDAVVCGRGKIEGRDIMIAVMDSRFIMASMGSVVGEKITRITEDAMGASLPLIIFCASGGARMQEGALSLMQLSKTSSAIARFREKGGLYIAVLTNPTTAGVMASFASLGDLIIAEPHALIGFTGQRVIKETLKTQLPDGFQTSEFMLEHGFLDMVVHRMAMREQLSLLLDYLARQGTCHGKG
ncbi:MAG: acetyl-CoA carboxylase carboxyltransferase subunit beta [Planctomycetes bacterium]|nr:acetyl-CoA carboxylase carboxyltransferase subunit beta [Planctomycetota bacterium]